VSEGPLPQVVAKTFDVDVDGVGHFVFRRRSLRDEFRVQAEVSRLTEGIQPADNEVWRFAQAVAAIKVLAVKVPDGWDIDKADPFDSGTYERIIKVSEALREREAFFRPAGRPQPQVAGEGA
jgi:hypothetical protein